MLKLSEQIDLHLKLLLLVLLEVIDFDLLYGDQLSCSEAEPFENFAACAPPDDLSDLL